jgi:hypothetical protein
VWLLGACGGCRCRGAARCPRPRGQQQVSRGPVGSGLVAGVGVRRVLPCGVRWGPAAAVPPVHLSRESCRWRRRRRRRRRWRRRGGQGPGRLRRRAPGHRHGPRRRGRTGGRGPARGDPRRSGRLRRAPGRRRRRRSPRLRGRARGGPHGEAAPPSLQSPGDEWGCRGRGRGRSGRGERTRWLRPAALLVTTRGRKAARALVQHRSLEM